MSSRAEKAPTAPGITVPVSDGIIHRQPEFSTKRPQVPPSGERATTIMRFRLIKATSSTHDPADAQEAARNAGRQASLVKRRAENRHARWERSCNRVRGAALGEAVTLSPSLPLSLSLSLFLSLQSGVSDITCIYGGGQTMGRRTEMNRVPFDVS